MVGTLAQAEEVPHVLVMVMITTKEAWMGRRKHMMQRVKMDHIWWHGIYNNEAVAQEVVATTRTVEEMEVEIVSREVIVTTDVW